MTPSIFAAGLGLALLATPATAAGSPPGVYRVTVNCARMPDTHVGDCRVVSQTPKNAEAAAAALKLTQIFRYPPELPPGSRIEVPITIDTSGRSGQPVDVTMVKVIPPPTTP